MDFKVAIDNSKALNNLKNSYNEINFDKQNDEFEISENEY